jgi:hypothetical protein
MINELQLDVIGREREAEILQLTFDERRQWITKCKPTFTDFCLKFPQLKEFNAHVSFTKFRLSVVKAQKTVNLPFS